MEETRKDLISVIIPVYNGEKNLPECLDSVLNQTHQNLEVIVVNDGSSDSTQNIIDSYADKDSRVNKIIVEKQQGVAAARNIAIENANGNYLAFIDGDDYINNDYFEILYCHMDDDVDIVCCGYNLVLDNKIEKYTLEDNILEHAEEAYLFYLNTMKTDYTMQVIWGKLFRKNIISDKRFELLRYGEDTLFIVRLIAANAQIKLIDYMGYNYREHNDSAISKSERKNSEYFDDMLNAYYLSHIAIKDVSDTVKEESAQFYKKKVIDVSLRLKKWYHDKDAFIQNSKTVKEHLTKVKSVCKLSFKDRLFLYMYCYCPKIAWYFI